MIQSVCGKRMLLVLFLLSVLLTVSLGIITLAVIVKFKGAFRFLLKANLFFTLKDL